MRLYNFTCLFIPSGKIDTQTALLVYFAEGDQDAEKVGRHLFSEEYPGARVLDETLSRTPDDMILHAANFILTDMDREAVKVRAN